MQRGENRHEAIEALGQKQFDLAFVNVRLPDMDGFELVRRIRSETDHLPCVLVSGFLYEDDDLVRDGLASHLIAGFIGKPFALLSQIHQTLESVVAQSPTDREDATLSNPGADKKDGEMRRLVGSEYRPTVLRFHRSLPPRHRVWTPRTKRKHINPRLRRILARSPTIS